MSDVGIEFTAQQFRSAVRGMAQNYREDCNDAKAVRAEGSMSFRQCDLDIKERPACGAGIALLRHRNNIPGGNYGFRKIAQNSL